MILGFNEIGKEDVIKAGGKGANLGEMVSAGINVPKGFVITADAYKEFLRINSLNELLKDELTKAGKDHAKLLKAAEKFRKSIKMGRLPENTVNEVKSAYQNLGDNILVAVRSSATAEDLSEASFAGQQESYLNIRGIDDVLDKIRDCYASLWGNRAVIYRANQNYNQLFVEIAVVIQEMVESEKAGVLFTLNPINNNTDEMQINSSYGLGESVVSGRVNADSYIVDKFGNIKYINIGSKQTKIIYDKNANREVEVSKELREKASLNENEVIKLVKVAKALKEHYRQDMDIEWAIKEGEVYILQARAVTTIKKNNDSELVKPYIKDIVMSKMLRKQMAFQLEKMPFAYRALDYDYMMGINNQKAIIFSEAGINLNSNPQIDDDGIQTMPKDSKGINRNIFKLFKTIKMLKDYKYCAKKCEAFMIDYENKISELKEIDFENMGMDECRKFLIYSLELLKSLSYDRFKYALFPSALNKDLEKVLKRINKNYTIFDLYKNLDNKTAMVSRDIEKLAEKIKSNDKIKAAIVSGENFENVCREFPEFKQLSKDFLYKNGFKSDYNCYCIDAKTFIEDPDRIINLIKPLLLQKDIKKDENNDFNNLMDEIREVGGKKYNEIKKRIEYFRYFHIVREESQYLWESLFYYVRQCLKRTNFLLTGKENYKEGVANLFHKELTEAMERGYLSESDFEKIKRRNQKYPLALKVWEASKSLVFDKAGEVLKGVSGSGGVAIGKACLIKSPKEFYKMKRGDILVCHLTDPEWTPLFKLAGGVVADTGSSLSHAAIVAREYQIPSVLGVGFATSRFKDGDIIKVDGNSGTANKVKSEL